MKRHATSSCALPTAAVKRVRILAGLIAAGMMAATLLGGAAGTAQAQVQPDDVITSADKVKDLVSPGVLQQVKNGLAMKEYK